MVQRSDRVVGPVCIPAGGHIHIVVRSDLQTVGGGATACKRQREYQQCQPHHVDDACSVAGSSTTLGPPTNRAMKIPSSYKMHSGTASNNCDRTSGGVKMAATMNAPTITYGRAFFSLSMVARPNRTSSTTTIGTSNVRPNAMNNPITKLKYASMSGDTDTDAGAKPAMNLK